MDREILIEVEHLTRYYGNYCALDDVSFTMARGEVLGFLGPNGAGKTTTMQILSGVLAPTRGRVRIAGHDIAAEPRAAKSHIGFLPEQPPLYTDLSVDQYLNYCARLRRVPAAERAAAVETSRTRCGLGKVGHRLIGNLSKGFQQRVGIAQAIIHSPAVVILDEPTVGLDPNQIVEIRALIGELGADHSVLLSTHILPEVQSVCDRVLIINEGRLVLDEHVDALAEETRAPVVSAAFAVPPDIARLGEIDGVVDVQPGEDAQHFRIACRDARSVPAAIARAAADGGWELYELVPQTGTLEHTFMRLTQGDAGAPAATS